MHTHDFAIKKNKKKNVQGRGMRKTERTSQSVDCSAREREPKRNNIVCVLVCIIDVVKCVSVCVQRKILLSIHFKKNWIEWDCNVCVCLCVSRMRWYVHSGPLSTLFYFSSFSLHLFCALFCFFHFSLQSEKVRVDLRAVTVFNILKVDIVEECCCRPVFRYDAIHLPFQAKPQQLVTPEWREEEKKIRKITRNVNTSKRTKWNKTNCWEKAKQNNIPKSGGSDWVWEKNIWREWDCDWTERLSFKLFFSVWRIQSRLAHTCKENTIVENLYAVAFLRNGSRTGKKLSANESAVRNEPKVLAASQRER